MVTLYVTAIFLVVALLLGCLLYALRQDMLRRENQDHLTAQLSALVNNMDSQLVDAMTRQIPLRIAARDASESSIATLARASRPPSGQILKLKSLLTEVKSAFPAVEELDLYFPASRLLVGTRGVRFLEDKKYRPDRMDAYWEQLGYGESLWLRRTETEGLDVQGWISHLRRYPGVFTPDEEPVLILSCREESFLASVRSCLRSLQSQDSLVLMDGKGTVLCSESPDLADQGAALLSGEEVTLPDGQKAMTACTRAHIMDWELAIVRTQMPLTLEPSFMGWILITILVMLLALGLVLYVHSKHYAYPMKRLVRQMQLPESRQGRLYSPDQTFSMMENQLENMEESRLEREQEIEKSRLQLREAYLNSLISDEAVYTHSLPELGILLPHDRLLCLMLSDAPAREEEEALNAAFRSLDCQVEIFQSRRREWICLLNLKKEDEERIPERLEEVVRDTPDSSLTFGVGLPVDRTAPLGVSYRCARRALTERYFDRNRRVCIFRTEEEHASADRVIAGIMVHLAVLPRLAAAGKTQEAMQRIEEIVTELRNMIPYLSTVRSVMLLTGAFLVQAAFDVHTSPQAVYGQDLMQVYYHLEDIESFEARMKSDCLKLAEYLKKESDTGNRSMVTLARQVIDKCPPADLSTQYVADALGISTGHLSRVFHQETGEKLMDCLQKKRMEHAARLLREGEMTNEEICEAIGYSRLQYFAGKFREYYGMTLSEYRQYSAHTDKNRT